MSSVHKDHLLYSTVRTIAYNYPNIKFICGSIDIIDILINKCNVDKKNVYYLDEYKKYNLGLIKCKLEPVKHDVPNHLIKIEMNNKKILYVVDTATMQGIEAKNYDYYLIEANYDEELLQQHLEEIDNTDDYNYLYRAKNTHLSKQQAIDFLVTNMGDNSEYKFIHMSEYNMKEE